MNLIQKWMNRETKAKLREENIRLQATIAALNNQPPHVCTVERNIQRVGASYHVSRFEKDMPPERYIKRKIVEQMIEYLEPFVEWNFTNDDKGNMIYRGSLCVSTAKSE